MVVRRRAPVIKLHVPAVLLLPVVVGESALLLSASTLSFIQNPSMEFNSNLPKETAAPKTEQSTRGGEGGGEEEVGGSGEDERAGARAVEGQGLLPLLMPPVPPSSRTRAAERLLEKLPQEQELLLGARWHRNITGGAPVALATGHKNKNNGPQRRGVAGRAEQAVAEGERHQRAFKAGEAAGCAAEAAAGAAMAAGALMERRPAAANLRCRSSKPLRWPPVEAGTDAVAFWTALRPPGEQA
jgi:hypothetical protein